MVLIQQTKFTINMTERKLKKKKNFISYNDNSDFQFLSKLELYDENENLLEETEYRDDSSIESKNIFKYDENSRLIGEKNFIDNNELTQERIIERNETGLIIRERINFMDASHTIKSYTRPEPHFIIIESVDSEEGLEQIEKIRTDDKNRILLREVFNEENNLSSKEEYIFKGEVLIERNLTNEADGLTHETFEYQDNKLLLHKVFSEAGNIIGLTEYSYNEKNQMTEQKFASGYHIVYKYDEEKNSRTEQHMQPNGIIEYQQEVLFDSEGNIKEERDFKHTTTYEYEFF